MANAWSVFSWPKVHVTTVEFNAAVQQMNPMDDESDGTGRGQSLWLSYIGGCPMAIAWEWAEALPGVPVLLDPMHILSNAVVVDEDGELVDEDQFIILLNTAVYQLPWQERLCRRGSGAHRRVRNRFVASKTGGLRPRSTPPMSQGHS